MLTQNRRKSITKSNRSTTLFNIAKVEPKFDTFVKTCDHEIPALWTNAGVTVGYHLIKEFFNVFLMELYNSPQRNKFNRWKWFIRKDLLDVDFLSGEDPRTPDDCWILSTWDIKQKLWDAYLETYGDRYDKRLQYRLSDWCFENLYDVMQVVFTKIIDRTNHPMNRIVHSPFATMENARYPEE